MVYKEFSMFPPSFSFIWILFFCMQPGYGSLGILWDPTTQIYEPWKSMYSLVQGKWVKKMSQRYDLIPYIK